VRSVRDRGRNRVTFGCAFYEIPAPSSTNDVGIDARWVPVSAAGFGCTGNFTGNSAGRIGRIVAMDGSG
jgi:hypothetical protein